MGKEGESCGRDLAHPKILAWRPLRPRAPQSLNPALLRPQREVKKIDNRFNCLTGTNIGLREVLCLAKCECD